MSSYCCANLRSLLAELGYAINLEVDCATHEPIEPDAIYRFIPDIGLQSRNLQSAEVMGANEFLGVDLIAIRDLNIVTNKASQSAKRLLRIALGAHLGDKPLNSRTLFASTQ